jgi:hypothetical protein
LSPAQPFDELKASRRSPDKGTVTGDAPVPNREPQVHDLTRGRDEVALYRDGAEARGVEEPDAVARQSGHQMDDNLVEHAGTKALRC